MRDPSVPWFPLMANHTGPQGHPLPLLHTPQGDAQSTMAHNASQGGHRDVSPFSQCSGDSSVFSSRWCKFLRMSGRLRNS